LSTADTALADVQISSEDEIEEIIQYMESHDGSTKGTIDLIKCYDHAGNGNVSHDYPNSAGGIIMQVIDFFGLPTGYNTEEWKEAISEFYYHLHGPASSLKGAFWKLEEWIGFKRSQNKGCCDMREFLMEHDKNEIKTNSTIYNTKIYV